MRGLDPLDAHLLAGQDVDRRADGPAKAVRPPAHAVQSRFALVHHRHGLHEPQPGRPRRPRVRLHLHADGPGTGTRSAEGGRRPLAGHRGARPPGRLDAGRGRRAGAPQPEGRPAGRQHAAGGRDRGRQGRGPTPLRRGSQRLRRERPGAADHRGLRRRGRSPGGPVRAALHAGPGAAQRRRPSRLRCTMPPAPSWACGTSSTRAVSRPLPIPSKTCTG